MEHSHTAKVFLFCNTLQSSTILDLCVFSHHTEIICLEPATPANESLMLSSQHLGVGVTAMYSCSPNYALVGETTRTCEDTNGGTTGTWSGTPPHCHGIRLT